MTRNHEELLPRILAALYPEAPDRARAREILSAYGVESHHREQPRVQLGILRVAGADLKSLAQQTALACVDYRDLLCNAEYSRTASRMKLRETDPEEYRRLADTEVREYDEWVARTLGEAES